MISFYSKLEGFFHKLSSDKIIEEIIVGLGYTYVDTGSTYPGLAYTFRFETDSTCSPLKEAGTIQGRKVREIIPWIYSPNILKVSIAIATFNSLLTPPPYQESDITKLEEIKEAKKIAMIGYFEPVVKKLKEIDKEVTIFEKRPLEGENFFRDWEIPYRINSHQVAIISSTTIINKTLPVILNFISRNVTIMLLGPTTPMIPDLFKDMGIKYLAGTLISNREKVKQIIKEGAGSRVFGKNVRRVISLV